MRKWLLAATAAAPLAFAAAGARATTTISNATSTPIATATALNGGPDNVDVATGGTVTVTATTPGVTLNSNNNVSVEGTVTASNVSGATGVLLNGGFTGGFTNAGSISVTETYAATDTLNSDGVVEAPFAQGTGRYGVRLIGSAPLVGTISLGGTGIAVKGQNSFGVSLEAPLQGPLSVSGPVTLTGDDGVALQEIAGVSGAVSVSGAISASGQASKAVVLGGDVGGSATFSSTVTASGYSQNTRATTDPAQANLQKTPADVEQGGTALTIAGSVAGGVLFTGVPTGTVSGTTADVNNDGVPDGAETAASVTSYGSAPAIQIGAPARVTTIGPFGATGYGLVFEGAVTGAGIYDGVSANALTIGVGGAVNVLGGALVTGTINATSYEANSTAIHLGTGANLPLLTNQGTISSVVAHSSLVPTPASQTSIALLLDPGSTLGSIVNTGTISASVASGASSSSAQAIVDASGSIAKVVNEGVISAVVTPLVAGSALTGRLVALDLSSNTSGVTLVQQTNPSPNTVYGSTSGTTATATTTVTAVVPQIVGDVLLGAGPNNVQILAGGLTGALSLGSGPALFNLDGGATYTGALSYVGSQLALSVGAATLSDTSASTLKLSSLVVGPTGTLLLAVDPVNKAATSLVVSGPATLAAGAKLGVTLLSSVAGTQSFTLISSPTLTTLGADTSLLSGASYLYNSSFSTDASGRDLILTLQQRSTTDLGLDRSEAAALPAVLAGVAANGEVERALLAPSTKAAFLKIYDQLLPDHGGGVFLAAQEASAAVSRNVSDHIDMHDPGAPQAWAKEFALGALQDKQTGDASHIGGFGFVGGLATSEGPLGALGVTAAFTDASVTDPQLSATTTSTFSELEAGLYWSAESGPLRLSARGGGGYLFGVTRRLFQAAATPGNNAVTLNTKAPWNGWTASGQLFASYQLDFGRLFVRPQAHVDYFTLSQDAYTDRNGGAGFDLAVNSRDGSETSGSATVVFGARFGTGVVWRPNIELGVKDVFSGDAGSTTAAFVGGGSPFTLTANPITGLGEVARIGLKADGELYEISIDAQAENFSHYREGDVGVTVRFHF